MDFTYISGHWYADWYEHTQTQTDDVAFLLKVLRDRGVAPGARLLEIACGGGRIAIPLAKAGYDVTGFDRDIHMLLNCCRKSRCVPNLRCHRMDAETGDWGEDFDAVVFAGNLLINIESDLDYAQSQKLFIGKAAKALRPGGHLYLDFALYDDPLPIFHGLDADWYEHTDDLGTIGRVHSYGSVFDPVTRVCAAASHTEITANNGLQFAVPRLMRKHIPTQAIVYGWLRGAGFEIERTYRNFSDEPLPEPVTEGTERATIWARKA